MSRSLTRLLSLGAVALALTAGGPAAADPPHNNGPGHPGKEMGRGNGNGNGKGNGKHDDRQVVVIERDGGHWDRHHRDVIVRYYDSHRISCPPGLVETRTGCLPRGQAKKRYAIGRPLPDTVIIETLPYDLMRQLPPPPHGYIYRRVDGDVLLIAEATKKVIDAVVLFSAL